MSSTSKPPPENRKVLTTLALPAQSSNIVSPLTPGLTLHTAVHAPTYWKPHAVPAAHSRPAVSGALVVGSASQLPPALEHDFITGVALNRLPMNAPSCRAYAVSSAPLAVSSGRARSDRLTVRPRELVRAIRHADTSSSPVAASFGDGAGLSGAPSHQSARPSAPGHENA